MSTSPKRAESSAPQLPPPPDRPDCCAGGCAQCVLDDYAEEMARWRAEVERIEAEHGARQRRAGADPARGSG